MPLSILGLLVVLALLALYAVIVSLMKIAPLESRRRGARWAAYVLAMFGVIVAVELHFVLLRYAFEQHGVLVAKAAAGAATQAQIAESSMATVTKLIAWVTPLVAAILPFLKSIAEKAVSSDAVAVSQRQFELAASALSRSPRRCVFAI
jgi:hypothetical protein